MPFDFRTEAVEEINGRRHKKITAVCDGCGVEKSVRRSWAASKMRQTGTEEYYCITCSSKRNMRIAREGMNSELLAEFLSLCAGIFANLYDDKTEEYIGRQLGSTAFGLIKTARDFVHELLEIGLDEQTIECAEYIEANTDQSIIELYSWETELRARAMLHLEQQPRPEGLKKK